MKSESPHACVHCEGGGCNACQRTGVCIPSDLFDDLSRRIKNLASRMDVILFNLAVKNEADRKALIEDVVVLQCFHVGAYREPSALLDKYIHGLENKDREKTDKNRKDTGSYFTPPYIAEYIVRGVLEKTIAKIKRDKRIKDKVRKILTHRICDPAVGGGIFLVCAHDYLMQSILEIDPKANTEDLSAKVVTSCLFGVDINPDAIEGCKLALHLNIAKWRLKNQIEEYAASAEQTSGSTSDRCDSSGKPPSAPAPAHASTSTSETTATSGKRKLAKRAGKNSKSRTGTAPNDSARSNAAPTQGSTGRKTTSESSGKSS